MERHTKHLKIFGRVQGVGYRAWTEQTANQMNLSGWVRNRNDGSVEAVITGTEKNLEKFIKACYDGPESANVETISVSEGLDELLKNFEVRPTA